MNPRPMIHGLADVDGAKKVGVIRNTIRDMEGKAVGYFEVLIALVAPENVKLVERPDATPMGSCWTFNVSGRCGDLAFQFVMSRLECAGDAMEIVGAEMGKLLHGIAEQVETASVKAGSLSRGDDGKAAES